MRFVYREPILAARILSFVVGVLRTTIGIGIEPRLSSIAGGLLLISIGVSWRAARRREGPWQLRSEPQAAIVLDLAAGALWIAANAANGRTDAYIAVIAATVLAAVRIGDRGILFGGIAYLAGRSGMEILRRGAGVPTSPGIFVSDGLVVVVLLLIIAFASRAFQNERVRAARALNRAESLQRVAADLAVETELDAVLRTIARSSLSLVDATHAVISLRRGDRFAVVAGAGTGEALIGVVRPETMGLLGEVLRARRTVSLDDYALRRTNLAVNVGIHSMVGMPILINGRFTACLMVGRTSRVPFAADEIGLLESLVSQASIAVRNARVLDRARRLESLSVALAAGPSEARVGALFVSEVAAAFDADFVVLIAFEGTRSRITAAEGFAQPLRHLVNERPGRLLQTVVNKRELISFDFLRGAEEVDGGMDVLSETARLAQSSGVRATLAAPILIGDRVGAVLIVGTTDAERVFDVIDRQDVLSFARAAGVAFQAAAAQKEREHRLARLSTLNELGAELALLHDPRDISRRAWEAAGSLLPRDAFYICRYDPAETKLTFLLRADEGVPLNLEPSVVPLGEGPTSDVIRTGAAKIVRADEAHGGRFFGDESRPSAAAIHVPIRVSGELVGVLSAQSYEPGVYDDEDVAILRSLANLVGTAFENADRLGETEELYLSSMRALAAAVDARDPYTRAHSARTSLIARAIGEELGLADADLRRLQLGALLHDIGKIGIPDTILTKPGPLGEDERVIMRAHPAIAGSILNAVEPLRDLVPIVVGHHERWDASGYPASRGGTDVPLAAYIVGVAEAFEVMVSRRAYKHGWPIESAEQELRNGRGSQFHPDAADALLRLIARDRAAGRSFLLRIQTLEQDEPSGVPGQLRSVPQGPGGLLRRYAIDSQTHGRQLAVLQRLAMQVSAVLDLDDLGNRLVRIICETMGFEDGWLTLVDPTTKKFIVRAAIGIPVERLGTEVVHHGSISRWVLEHGTLVNVPDVLHDERFQGQRGGSCLIVPLRVGDEAIGVLGVASPKVNAFGRDAEELIASVAHQVAAAVRVAQLHRVATTAASTDPLTALPNRRMFFERLASTLAERNGTGSLSLAMVDVNGLKMLNDGYGHGTGDEALVRIGEILAAGVRDNDLVARIGGDEFGIVFPGAPLLAAERIMRRLAENVGNGHLADGKSLPSIAWGVVDTSLGGVTADALVEAADRAMYRHKQLSGRQRIS